MYQHQNIEQLTTVITMKITKHRRQHNEGDGYNLKYHCQSQYQTVLFQSMSEFSHVTGDNNDD